MTDLQYSLKISKASLGVLASVAVLGPLVGTFLGSTLAQDRIAQSPVGPLAHAMLLNRSEGLKQPTGYARKVVASLQKDAGKDYLASIGPFIQQLSHGQLQLVSQAPGPDGLVAVNLVPIGQPNAQHIIGWVMPGNGGLLLGPLLDPNGVNENVAFEEKLGVPPPLPPGASSPAQGGPGAPEPAMTPAEVEKFMRGADFSGFHQGSGPVHLAIFVDANCSICHGLWSALEQDKGWEKRFTIDWIPVGSFKPTSMAMGASLLAGGVKALSYNELHFDLAQEVGGIRGSDDPKLLAALQKNTVAFEALATKDGQEPGTPTIVINNKQVSVGLPSPAEMAQMTGAQFP